MREQVKWFAEQMENKLQENDHKGGWNDCGIGWLLIRLREEAVELEEAIESVIRKDDIERVIKEAADVANFAMMIADIAKTQRDAI